MYYIIGDFLFALCILILFIVLLFLCVIYWMVSLPIIIIGFFWLLYLNYKKQKAWDEFLEENQFNYHSNQK